MKPYSTGHIQKDTLLSYILEIMLKLKRAAKMLRFKQDSRNKSHQIILIPLSLSHHRRSFISQH